MAEPRARGRIGLPVADDEAPITVEAPVAEKTTETDTAKAAAERRKQISAAKDKKPPAEAKPAFVPNKAVLDRLYGLTDEELIKEATEAKLLRQVDADDRRVFQWTGSRTDATRGQPVDRSKLRSAVVVFMEQRENHIAEGRVIHAFMFLAGPEVHGGKYDSGYVATRRGENKSRGMVARGYLRILSEDAATHPVVITEAEAPVAEIEAPAESDGVQAEVRADEDTPTSSDE